VLTGFFVQWISIGLPRKLSKSHVLCQFPNEMIFKQTKFNAFDDFQPKKLIFTLIINVLNYRNAYLLSIGYAKYF